MLNLDIQPRFDRLKAISSSLDKQVEQYMLDVTDEAADRSKESIRNEMRQSGLGRLSNAIGSTSDKKQRTIKRRGERVSTYGAVFIRSRSPRTVGAIKSYTEGSDISPRKGRYLWIATDDIKRLARVPLPSTGGRSRANVRLQPHLWDRTYGRTLGPLIPIRGKDGMPLLVIKDTTVSASGKSGSVKPRTKTGKVRKGQVEKDIVVAFNGIPNTKRAARINPEAIVTAVVSSINQQELSSQIKDVF